MVTAPPRSKLVAILSCYWTKIAQLDDRNDVWGCLTYTMTFHKESYVSRMVKIWTILKVLDAPNTTLEITLLTENSEVPRSGTDRVFSNTCSLWVASVGGKGLFNGFFF
ncbi:hypothetical protein PanWU01x14_146230 [Parasponia andersonii]|uniref:Uncharacterized protein n=1 Tax=Parasponia andersonii TaxID=3476 RepID=A0A2P5CJQ8_PARAD|nr:hypothetical protein PanWU01x14_146230 [Parasponia andersonii]